MEMRADPHIINCDLMGGGIVVSFDDGTSALYSGPLKCNAVPSANNAFGS
jgi:hypothetical protein